MTQCQNQQKYTSYNIFPQYVTNHNKIIDGFKSFQNQAINILALSILTNIKKITWAIKRVLSLQGVTMPNCLHIVDYLHQSKFVDLIKLVQFINHNQSGNVKNIQSFYSGLQNLGRSLFSEQTQQVNGHKVENLYPNIKYIPHVYLFNPQQNALPIKLPVDEGLKKPAQYTYKNVCEKVQKVDKNIQKLSNYSMRQMRRSLGILSMQEGQQQTRYGKQRKIMKKQQFANVQNKIMKSEFSMINYI